MQPPYLWETSKKERSQSRYLRGTGSSRENRRSFLALEFWPCGTVRGHGITVATLHSELLSLIPPGPCSFQPPPLPTHSGLCQKQQMDTHFVIISRARRLGPSLVTQSDSSATLIEDFAMLKWSWVHWKVGKAETTAPLQIPASCISCTYVILSRILGYLKR